MATRAGTSSVSVGRRDVLLELPGSVLSKGICQLWFDRNATLVAFLDQFDPTESAAVTVLEPLVPKEVEDGRDGSTTGPSPSAV